MVWIKPNEELETDNENLLLNIVFGCCISAADIDELIFMNIIMITIFYLTILKTGLKKAIEKMNTLQTSKFYQGNDSKPKRSW